MQPRVYQICRDADLSKERYEQIKTPDALRSKYTDRLVSRYPTRTSRLGALNAQVAHDVFVYFNA